MMWRYALLTVLLFTTSAAFAQSDDLARIVQQLQNEVQGLKAENTEMREDLAHTKNEVAELKVENKAMRDERQMTADTMFLATISATYIEVPSGEAIVWDSAPINPGDHFNTVLGMYEAPVDGYYQFSVTKNGDNNYGSFYFTVDEVRYAMKELETTSDPAPSSAATINIQLTAGQLVRVQNVGSTVVYGTNTEGFMWSWFTGHLLYAL